jgi:hypothetical protein
MGRVDLDGPDFGEAGLRLQGSENFNPLRSEFRGFGPISRLTANLAGARPLGDRPPAGFFILPGETAALLRVVFGVVLVCFCAMVVSFPWLQTGFGHYST